MACQVLPLEKCPITHSSTVEVASKAAVIRSHFDESARYAQQQCRHAHVVFEHDTTLIAPGTSVRIEAAPYELVNGRRR